ncbi:hypothetical protein [Bradyrhizobium sp. USDA 4506]
MMNVAALNTTANQLSVSEQVERRSARLLQIWERDVLRRDEDLHEAGKLLAEVDEVLPGLEAYASRLASISRPASDDEVTNHLIAIRLNFHNSKASGEGYGRIMTERVLAKQPSFAALEWATRYIIDHSKFMPVTAEVLEQIDAASLRLQRVVDIVRTLPARRQRLARQLNLEAPGAGSQ